jgi:hypothetical protein
VAAREEAGSNKSLPHDTLGGGHDTLGGGHGSAAANPLCESGPLLPDSVVQWITVGVTVIPCFSSLVKYSEPDVKPEHHCMQVLALVSRSRATSDTPRADSVTVT